jgi:hypothetical protein
MGGHSCAAHGSNQPATAIEQHNVTARYTS